MTTFNVGDKVKVTEEHWDNGAWKHYYGHERDTVFEVLITDIGASGDQTVKLRGFPQRSIYSYYFELASASTTIPDKFSLDRIEA